MWKEITESDLAAVLSQAEIDAFRQDGSTGDGSDPVEHLLAMTAAHVRTYLVSNSAVKIPHSAPRAALPAALVAPAVEIAAYKILKRLPVPVGEDRKKAAEEAEAFLDKIARGVIVPEPDEGADGQSQATTPRFTDPRPPRRLD